LRKYIPSEKIVEVKQVIDGCNTDEQAGGEHPSGDTAGNGSAGEPMLRGAIDIFTGLQYCAENKQMYREFLKMFCDMKEEKKQRIEELFAGKAWEDYAVAVHALKSTSLSIGAKRLSEEALALEKAGKEQKEEFIMEHHAGAMYLYELTVREGYQILMSEIC